MRYGTPRERKQPQKILRKFQVHLYRSIGLLLLVLMVEVKWVIGLMGGVEDSGGGELG